jgi:GNAT superfamily N-acetyltransferase
VLPLYGAAGPLSPRIERCEALSAAWGVRPVFKIADPEGLAELDAELERRGYAMEAPTTVMALLSLPPAGAPPAARPGLEASLEKEAGEEWYAAFLGFSGIEGRKAELARAIMSSIAPDRRFLLLKEGGEAAACALVVVEAGWAGIFDVVVRKDRRGKGLGRGLMGLALAEAARAGARRSYLQVMDDNAEAIGLYASLGYVPAYGYFYRAKGDYL